MDIKKNKSSDLIKVVFILPNSKEVIVYSEENKTILDIAREHDVELEGICEGSLACSTCHVIIDKEFFTKLPEPSDAELDLLDLAFGLEDCSRLGCQIILTKALEGIRLKIPSDTRNIL